MSFLGVVLAIPRMDLVSFGEDENYLEERRSLLVHG